MKPEKRKGELSFDEAERLVGIGLDPTRYRASGATGERWISGYLARYNSPCQIGGRQGFTETLKPGCFDRTLRDGGDIICAINHETGKLLARRSNGTLELKSDKYGLWFAAKLPEGVSYADDALALVETQTLKGCSFAGVFLSDRWTEDFKRRNVLEVQLFEGGPVAQPAYESTSVGLGRRSGDEVVADSLLSDDRSALEAQADIVIASENTRQVMDSIIAEQSPAIRKLILGA